jgi:hypothetical protein
LPDGRHRGHAEIVGAWRKADAEDLKSSVRKDVQVRVLPPLPKPPDGIGLGETQFRAYAYLLGIYLGDGHITHYPRTFRIEIYLNAKETRVIRQTVEAMRTVMPDRRVGFRYRPAVIVVNSYSQQWPRLFPQHGPGRKHCRPIVLEPWQRAILEREPEAFIRGCLDSDGCRHRRIVNGTNYPAYSFTNRSEDILGLFTATCDVIGLRWTRANHETISIARRREVAYLDGLIARAADP